MPFLPYKHVFAAASLIVFCHPLAAEPVQISREGRVEAAVVASDEALRPYAERLRRELAAITGAPFERDASAGSGKIILGLRSNFPDVLAEPVKDETSTWKERYRIVSKNGNLYLVGETPLAVGHAVADLLHRIGYRYLIPPKAWIVRPSIPDLSVDLDVTEQPKYAVRTLFMGITPHKEVAKVSAQKQVESNFGAWRRHMRAFSEFKLRTGHAWLQMIRRHEAEFVAHPEWIVEGSPDFRLKETDRNVKFNLHHPELLALLQQDSIQWLRDNPESDSVSVDPSDGGNWPKQSPLGTPSDQVVYLANAVSKAIREEFPEKKVAFYAYHFHSPPPERTLEPNIVVSIATGFIRGGYTVKQLMKGWREKGAELGIRDYTNVFFGSWDLPGGNYHAFSPHKTVDNLRTYYQDGARYWTSEASPSWGAIGLGTYVAFHTLWNPVDGPSADELVNDFVEKAFGKGAPAMHEYFKIVAPEANPLVSEDLTGKMYDAISKALQADLKPEERTRVLHMASYVRFVELMHDFLNSEVGKPEEAAYRALATWAIRCRDFQMINTRGILTNCIRNKPNLEPIRDEVMRQGIEVPTEAELEALVAERRVAAKRITFQPITYSEQLKPIEKNVIDPEKSAKNFAFAQAKRLRWVAQNNGDTLTFKIRNLGKRPVPPPNTSIALKLVDDVFDENAVDLEIPADTQEWQTVSLKAPVAGQYEVKLLTQGGYIELDWERGTPIVMPSGQVGGSFLHDVWDACFYVPANVDRIGGYSDRARGVLVSDEGEVLYDFSKDKGPGYFDIAITPSSKGRIFRFRQANGRKILMTVPPYLARYGDELLVPESKP